MSGLFGYEERVSVKTRVVRPLLRLRWRSPLRAFLRNDFFEAPLEHVRAALQKERAKNVLLEFRGIHLAAKDVGGGEEMTFELGEGEGHWQRWG